MFSNLRISFSLVLFILISASFISAQTNETFFQIRNGLNINGFGSFESNLPSDSNVTGNLSIRGNNEYVLELLEGEKFNPEKAYVSSMFGIVNFRTLLHISLYDNGEKAVISGDGSINLPSIKGYIIKGTNMNLTLKNGVFSNIGGFDINGDSSFDLDGINIYFPDGVVLSDVIIVNNVVHSFMIRNKLDKDLQDINVDKINDMRIKQGKNNYIKLKTTTDGGYELTGSGSSIGDLYELKEDQAILVDNSGKISFPAGVNDNTISLRNENREITINKLESSIRGVNEIKPFARGNVKIVNPGDSVRDVQGAAVQFGVDKDNKLNLVFKDFSAANINGYGKIDDGKPYPERSSPDVGTNIFVNRVIFYNGPRKIEQVYEGSSWKEMSGKVVKTNVGKDGISGDNNVKDVLDLLGDPRSLGNGAFLEYKNKV